MICWYFEPYSSRNLGTPLRAYFGSILCLLRTVNHLIVKSIERNAGARFISLNFVVLSHIINCTPGPLLFHPIRAGSCREAETNFWISSITSNIRVSSFPDWVLHCPDFTWCYSTEHQKIPDFPACIVSFHRWTSAPIPMLIRLFLQISSY